MRLRIRKEVQAGRSANANYERALKRWRSQIRLPLFAAAAVLFPLAIPIWLYAPLGQFYAGALFGATAGMVRWIWDDPPDYIARWKRGAEGERLTWKALRPLEADGWRTFHDRDGEYGNIDHIVVGRGGVFLLDSKNLGGTVVLEPEGLTMKYESDVRSDFTNTRLEAAMRGAAARLKKRVESATHVRPWVQAVVVVWGEFPEARAEGDRVVYVAGAGLCEWLKAQQGRLSVRDQRLVELALDAEIVAPPAPAVGSVSPASSR